MIVWDTGVWAPMEDVEKSLASGAFKFRLAGEKLNGGWMLARLKPKPGDDDKKNWLLFKERDLAADAEDRHPRRAPGKREDRAADRGTGRAAETRPGRKPAKLQARRAAGRGEGAAAGAHRSRSLPRGRRGPPGGRRAGCTRSSSTATAPWRMCRTARCG